MSLFPFFFLLFLYIFLASKQTPLTPHFVPIPLHGGCVSPHFGTPHPGGVTCVKVSHARSGMELYTCGKDHTVKLWRIVSPSTTTCHSKFSKIEKIEIF